VYTQKRAPRVRSLKVIHLALSIVFMGPAGSGKTTLTYKFGEWLRNQLFAKVAYVNLDPGADEILYNPVFDVKSIITLHRIMEQYKLGPNGAFIKSIELLAENIDYIFNQRPFNEVDQWDYILIDTPGQMEAFLFRRASNVFFKHLKKISNALIVFIIDLSAIENIPDLITLWFMHVLINIKYGLTVIPVFNKADLVEDVKYVKMLVEKPDKLMKIVEKRVQKGLISEIAPDLVSIAVKTKAPIRPIIFSALNQTDFTDLYSIVHEAFCACGDLT